MAALGVDIRQAVLAVLPSLPEDKLQSILMKLESIGVETRSDLQFIKDEDLPANITPIQCRKHLNAWKNEGMSSIMFIKSLNTKATFIKSKPGYFYALYILHTVICSI